MFNFLKKGSQPKKVSYPKKGNHSNMIEKVKDRNGKTFATIFHHTDGSAAIGKHRK